MSVGRNLVILGIWTMGMGAWAWWKYVRIDDNLSLPGVESDTSNRPAATPGVEVSWKWSSESAWLVDQISRDIAEISLFATGGKPGNEEVAALELTVEAVSPNLQTYLVAATAGRSKLPKTSATLPLNGHIWSPDNYVPWVQALQRGWKINPGKPSPSAGHAAGASGLAGKLLEPTGTTLIEEAHRLSKALNQSPMDARLHEQAALVIGTLGLREAAGAFSDVRTALCRMTAHLAFARALSNESSAERDLADAVLLSLACRQQDALQQMAKLPPGLEAWQRALKLRNTNDWRLLEKPGEATLLERLEQARALVSCRDASAMLKNFGEVPPPDLPDWSRIGTERNFSVGEGHALITNWVEREMADLSSSWKAWSGKELKTENLVVVLNDPPTRCLGKGANGKPALEVLGWGFVAATHQRHLCHAIERTQLFLQDKWGVADAAAGFEQQVLQHFAGMRLLPFVLKRIASTEKQQRNAMAEASALCRKQPEYVTCCNWATLRQKGRFPVNAAAVPRPQSWFTQELPLGTAYDFEARYHDLGTLYNASAGFWDKLAGTAPYHYHVIRTYLYKQHGNHPTLDQIRTAYATIADYHLLAMQHISDQMKEDPKAYLAYMTRVCQLNPDEFIDLGEYLVEKGLPEDGAFAYQAASEMATDRVSWANHAGWLVNYYFEKGRTEEAVKIAQGAAEVYSYRGLETMAKLMDRMERWDEAAQHYTAIAERYQDNGPLLAFLQRNKDRDPKLAEAYKSASDTVFPEGMKTLTMEDCKEAPTEGVEFTTSTPLLQRHGLKRGQVIVALDGQRVQNLEQYLFVRSLQTDAPLDLIIWDGAAYKQLTAKVPNRKFGCDMESYIK